MPMHSDDRLRAKLANKRSGEIEDRQARDLVAMVERVASDPRLAARFVAAVLAAHAVANPDAPERAPAPHVPMGRTIPLTPEEWAKLYPPAPAVDPRAVAACAEVDAIKIGAPELVVIGPMHIRRAGPNEFYVFVNGVGERRGPFDLAQIYAATIEFRTQAPAAE